MQERRVRSAAKAGAFLVWLAAIVLIVVPPFSSGVFISISDLIPRLAVRGESATSPSGVAAVALLVLLGTIASAPLLSRRPSRPLVVASASAIALFAAATLLYVGLLFIPGAVALLVAAFRTRDESARRSSSRVPQG